MFQSPLKTVAEKIKPTDTKSSVSSLRFDRSSDFKKFIKFIKNETEQLEKIKLPTTTEIKGRGGSKLPGAAGILGLGLFGLIASLFGGDDKGKGDNKFRVGGAEASSIPTVPPLGLGTVIRKTPVRLTTPGGIGTLKRTSSQVETQAQDEKYIRDQKKRRQKKIKNIVKNYKLKFMETFEMFKTVELEDLKMEYGSNLSDVEIGNKFYKDKFLNPEGLSLDEKIRRDVIQYMTDFEGMVDPTDQAAMRETVKNLKIDELLNEVEKPLNMDDINLLKKLVTDTDPSSQDALEALEILRSPEAQTVIKEDKFQKITGKTTPKATSFFGGKFTPKYALDDFFTGIGKKTKGSRDFMSRPFMKSSGKPTGFGKALMPAMGFGGKLLRGGGFGLDLFSAIFATAELIDGFIVGDNILTAYYDLGVAIHNAFEPDKTKLMFYITKSRNAKKNAFTDKKNQKILQQINEAKKSQVNNNQVSAQEGSSGIVPFAKSLPVLPMGITMVPTIYSWKFITEKLYKQ